MKLHLPDGVKPVFKMARPVPHSIRGEIETELERLENSGILNL